MSAQVADDSCQHKATEIAKAMSSAKLIFKWGLKNKRLLHFVRNDTGVLMGMARDDAGRKKDRVALTINFSPGVLTITVSTRDDAGVRR